MHRPQTPSALESLPGFTRQALQQALQDELRLDRDYESAPLSAAARVRAVFECALFDFLGGRHSILRLPTELLVEALSYLDFDDKISVSHVCRRWRSVSLATSRLWSYLSSVDIRTEVSGALASLFERTQGVPVTVYLLVDEANALSVSECLFYHLHHIKSLDLQFGGELEPWLHEPLRTAMERPAPILRDFTLWDVHNTFLPRSGIRWFGGEAPLLDRLKLRSRAGQFFSSGAFLNTRRLLFHSLEDNGELYLSKVVDNFPNLDTLAVSVGLSTVLPEDIDGGTLQRLSRLERLAVLVESRRVSLLPIIPWLSQLNTAHITLSWERVSPNRNEITDIVAAIMARLGRIEHLSLHYTKALNIDLRDTAGLERSFLEVPLQLRPGAEIFAQLTRLTLSELAWTLGDVLPPAPALLELRVFLLRPWSHRPESRNAHSSVFLLPPLTRERALVCPPLRRVEFIARAYNRVDPSDEPTIVAPLQIRQFLEWQLVYDANVLDVLAFVGVMLLQSHLDDILALFAMARDVDINACRPSDARPIDDVISWDNS